RRRLRIWFFVDRFCLAVCLDGFLVKHHHPGFLPFSDRSGRRRSRCSKSGHNARRGPLASQKRFFAPYRRFGN
ncbi:MAG: hypothetical protein RSD95_13420, partial [Clostridia bacterium]